MRPCGCGDRGRHRGTCALAAGGAAAVDEAHPSWCTCTSCSARAPVPVELGDLGPLEDATVDLRAEVERALARVGELEQRLAVAERERDAAEAAAHAMEVRQGEIEAEYARELELLRAKVFREAAATHLRKVRTIRRVVWGGYPMRELRGRLRMALLMVDRLRVQKGERPHRRIGGVEDMQQRAAELPRPDCGRHASRPS